jgi:hypothetical protein
MLGRVLIRIAVSALALAFAALPTLAGSAAVHKSIAPYQWRTVPIGGGGYITGMVIHPNVPDLVYIRTDVGGAARWDATKSVWTPIANAETVGGLFPYASGVESIAIDPQNPDVVYMVVGMYRAQMLESWGQWKKGDPNPSAAFKSTDRGETWTRLNFNPSSGANEDWRWVGERLAVDPNDSNVVLFGSRSEGLWRSADTGKSWQIVTSLPISDDQKLGVAWIIFDPASGNPGTSSKIIYAAVTGKGIFRSADSGGSWALLTGNEADTLDNPLPTYAPKRAALASNGTLYAAFYGDGGKSGVWRYDTKGNRWKNITPKTGIDYNAIAVDPRDPYHVIAVELKYGFQSQIFRSEDGGGKWRIVQSNANFSAPWYPKEMWASAVASVSFDPHHTNRVWYTDWYNVWRTDDVTRSPSDWTTQTAGHEETVVFTLATPPQGAPLFSGMADIMGFRHESTTAYPSTSFGNMLMQYANGIDYAASDPNQVVLVGGWQNQETGNGALSADNGKTWTKFENVPGGARWGKVAFSADGKSIVWIPTGMIPYYSDDGGKTWTDAGGVPPGLVGDQWSIDHPIAADRVTPGRFYIARGNSVTRSDDGGKTWQIVGRLADLNDGDMRASIAEESPDKIGKIEVNGVPAAPNYRMVQTAQGIAGEVWVQRGSDLYVSTNAAETFTRIDADEVKLFALGKSNAGNTRPTIYLYGKFGSVYGLFRSDDSGTTWAQLDSTNAPLYNASVMMGDQQEYGRIYIGLNGRGVWTGAPAQGEK